MSQKKIIYLDYNSTAPMLPEVAARMADLLHTHHNPSSMHQMGQKGRQYLTQARQKLANFLGADPEYIIFTSGGTEANNQALRSVPWDNIIISSIEHDSVYKAVQHPHIISVDSDGRINMSALEEKVHALRDKKNLISIIWGNNETGVLQPLSDIITCAKKYGAYVHADAAQVIGKQPIDFDQCGLDMMTVTAHKFGGPIGVGALIAKKEVPLNCFIRGGGQEKGRRSGTENVSSIIGFGIAAEKEPDLYFVRKWHIAFERRIQEASGNTAYLLSGNAPRLPNTSYISMPGLSSSTQVIAFDLDNILISAGSSCSSGRVKQSRIAAELTHDNTIASTAVRFSSGWATTEQDLEKAGDVWIHLFQKLKQGPTTCINKSI